MAEKKYSLSLEQLNELVSDAVATAIKKLDNVEIIDDSTDESTENKANVEVSQMDDKQYREAMDTMAKNRGAGDELITCSEMHEDVWKKELRRQKYHTDFP